MTAVVKIFIHVNGNWGWAQLLKRRDVIYNQCYMYTTVYIYSQYLPKKC